MTEQEKRELLIRLAEKVMGGELIGEGSAEPGSYCYCFRLPNGKALTICRQWASVESWNPLESISDAWMLVEALRKRGWQFQISCGADGDCEASFDVFPEGKPDLHSCEIASLPSEAICLAAMRSTEGR